MNKTQRAFAKRIKNERSLLEMDLISDVHNALPKPNNKLESALKDMQKRQVAHLILCGDLTNNGYAFQMGAILTQLQRFPIHVIIALGNHDLYHLFSHTQNHIHPTYRKFLPASVKGIYFDVYIEGIHFYVLNSEQPDKDDMCLTQKQIRWLLEQLKQDDKSKPVFIIAHQPLQHTHPMSEDACGSLQRLTSAMLKAVHPHIVFISGHLHNSYTMCQPLLQNDVCFINLPSFVQIEHGNDDAQIGFHLCVYTDFLYLRTRDYRQERWIRSHEFIIQLTQHKMLRFDADDILANTDQGY